MKPLNFQSLEKLPFDLGNLVGDLIYAQGPLLALYVNTKSETYLLNWCGCDEAYNRWMIYKTSPFDLDRFIQGSLSNYKLFLESHNDSIYSVDIDKNNSFHNIQMLSKKEIPSEYLPDKDVYFEEQDCFDLKKIKVFIENSQKESDGLKTLRFKEKYKNLNYDSHSDIQFLHAAQRQIAGRQELMSV